MKSGVTSIVRGTIIILIAFSLNSIIVSGAMESPHIIKLRNDLKDKDPEIRKKALQILSLKENRLEGNLKYLHEVLNDKDAKVRRVAVTAISYHDNAKSIIPLIKTFKREENSDVIMGIASVLGKYTDSRVSKALLDKYKGQDYYKLKRSILMALRKQRDKAAYDLLVKEYIANISLSSLSTGAVKTLGNYHEEYSVVEVLIDNYSNSYSGLKRAVLYCLGKIGTQEAEEFIIKNLENTDKKICCLAASILGDMGNLIGLDVALENTKHEDSLVRRVAIQAFYNIKVVNKAVFESILAAFDDWETASAADAVTSTVLFRSRKYVAEHTELIDLHMKLEKRHMQFRGESESKEKKSIAVMDFKALGVAEGDAVLISDFFRETIQLSYKAVLVDRKTINNVLAEQENPQEGCNDVSCAKPTKKVSSK